jgi:uncharacterized protein YegL
MMHARSALFAAMIMVLLFLPSFAPAIGIILPNDRSLPPLAIISHVVNVEITDNAAKTTVEQVFYNRENRQLEATYLFPLPKGADVTDFAMVVNGKRVRGEVLERHEARQIYEDIVRRMRDPALLEYFDGKVFKLSIFPIPARGKQKIEIQFAQVLPLDSGVAHYVYPMRIDPGCHAMVDDLREFHFNIRLRSNKPIKSIYSPSHELVVERESDQVALIRLADSSVRSLRDFSLFYSLSEKDYGLTILTHKPAPDADGVFLLMINPRYELDRDKVNPKDVTFVLDTSGSMAHDGKLESAKKALVYCLERLDEKDRFSLVRFSTEVEVFGKGLMSPTKENLDHAKQFIEQLEPRGGTNINDALLQALAPGVPSDRLHTIVFLTDGRPTVGQRDVSNILNNIQERNTASLRIFVFGVGYDVNTQLLDLIAQKTRGVAEYIAPEEEIELRVSGFFDKVRYPVLTHVTLDFGQMNVTDLYPKEIPDLFRGSQLLVFGRYRTASDAAITLSGIVGGEHKQFVYEETFPDTNPDNTFIETLWATRRIGYLLDEIRLNGEDEELRNEVIRLAKQYGIVTPYTSYLVQEDTLNQQPVEVANGLRVRPAPGPVSDRFAPVPLRGTNAGMRRNIPADENRPYSASRTFGYVPDSLGWRWKEDSLAMAAAQPGPAVGKAAVERSIALRDLKQSEQLDVTRYFTRQVGTKTFTLQNGWWIDDLAPAAKKTVGVKYLSDAYFRLLEVNSDLKGYLALGEQVKVVVNDILLEVGPEGKETLAQAELGPFKKQ